MMHKETKIKGFANLSNRKLSSKSEFGPIRIKRALNSLAGTMPTTAIVEITSAQILAMNLTPIVLIQAPGVGKYIEIVSASVVKQFNTIAYTTNVTATIFTGTNNNLGSFDIGFAATEAQKISTIAQLSTENEPVTLEETTGNPAAGDGTLKFYISYIVRDIV